MQIAAVLIRPTETELLEVDDPTAVCLLRLEASRLAVSADPLDLALSLALTRGVDAILNGRNYPL